MERAVRAIGKAFVVVGVLALALMALTMPRPLLTEVEERTISPWSSCGLRTVQVAYQGETYGFDLTDDPTPEPPVWWWYPDVEIRVGRYVGEVWAIGPEGLTWWRLIRIQQASLLYCIW